MENVRFVSFKTTVSAMEKIVEQGILYDFYGGLLTAHQREVYEQVVYEDMSLAEIAQAEGISKQAVSDLVKRTTAQMQGYEETLGMIEKFRSIKSACAALKKAAEEGDVSSKTAVAVADEIERVL